MRIELKGLIAAVVAGLTALGAAFGVSALVVRAQADHAQTEPARTPVTQKLNTAAIAQGHAFFTQSCASCHGPNGEGAFGPSLRHEDMSDARIAQTVKRGVPGKMPAFGQYSDAQMQALIAYIRSLP